MPIKRYTDFETVPMPKQHHESFVCGLLGQPDVNDLIIDAAEEVQQRLQACGWPVNTVIYGILFDVLFAMYVHGERRGAAREGVPASALYPVNQSIKPLDQANNVG